MAVFTVHNFEKRINSTILQRGSRYYRQGKADDVAEKEKGFWTGTVIGSYDNYEVEIYLEGDEVTDWECNCPYDGDVCKHIVASLYQIQSKLTKPNLQVAANNLASQTSQNTSSLHSKESVGVYKTPETPPSPPVTLPHFKEPAGLYAYYQKDLKITGKRLIKLMAVLWEGATAAQLSELYNATFSHLRGSVVISSVQIRASLENLKNIGYLHTKGNQFLIDPPFADYLCDREWQKDKEFEYCIHPIRRRFDNDRRYSFVFGDRLFRDFRFAFYQGDVNSFINVSRSLVQHKIITEAALQDYYLPPADGFVKLESAHPEIRFHLIEDHLDKTLLNLDATDAYFDYATKILPSIESYHRHKLAKLICNIALLRGDWAVVNRVKPFLNAQSQAHTEGVFQLLKAKTQTLARETAAYFEKKQADVKTYAYNAASYDGLEGMLYFLALLKPEEAVYTQLLQRQLKHLSQYSTGKTYKIAYQSLEAVLKFLDAEKHQANKILDSLETETALIRFFYYLATYWVDEKALPLSKVKSFVQDLDKNGYQWLSYEIYLLLHRVEPKAAQWQNALDKHPLSLEGDTIEPLLNVVPKIDYWHMALKNLRTIADSVAPKKSDTKAVENETRLVWLIDFESMSFQAKEQKMGKKGWLQGRTLSGNKLHDDHNPSFTAQDKAIIKASQKNSWDYNSFDIQKAIPHFIGHPLLFLAKSPEVSLDFSEAKPVLIAKEVKDGYQISFSPTVKPDLDMFIVKESPTRYKLVRPSAEQKRIARALGSDSLFVPTEGREFLQEILGGLVNLVPVQSALDTEGGQNVKTVEADSRICVHLLPVGEGIHVELMVRPFPDSPPYFKPSKGEAVVFTEIKEEQFKTTRNLTAEKENFKKLLASVEMLQTIQPRKGIYELVDAGECLDLLLQLQPLMDDKSIILEWPKGEKYKLQAVAGFDEFRMNIGPKDDWFSVNGELRVNENMVFDMQKLLNWLEKMKGGFIEISPGQFLALKKDFLRKLRDIAGVLMPQRDGTFQMHPLALPVMEGFTEALVNADIHQRYAESLDRLKKAFNTNFDLPEGFKATLRPYQMAGYEWLCRSAMWGVGACLADDMGLGKTVQALALVQRRHTEGATLVVAPASVCRNWIVEIKKFTPQLTPLLFGEGDRAATVEQAGKGDVVIVTYDLMAREADLFIQKQFTTIILDEAQAIKNRLTRRSETAMLLQGDFKIAMSGTPLENHLGELWNLFQFINPGLLGSMAFFNDRFATPIERYRDEERQMQLRNLVQPFILRRRKDEVLKELPAKTEITLTVELSEKERAFYEALRRSVVAQLEAKFTEGGNEGQKQMQILAEITRLRRAACHPKLVDDNVDILDSAKLKLFQEITDELLENGHKALVFSQFVGHLTILRRYLDDKNIPYQYLDGSTPMKKRQERIEAFQKGEGAFFLISLKAGGVGLNLTEADYVLHMDPWWNPAVEDQATDRAHRIGQEKPVTVYRLVTEGTIEEKILKLHDTKRDLADSLLAGTDAGVKLTADELMALLKTR